MATWSEHKFVLLGYPGCGKSAISIQWINCHFIEDYDPTVQDVYRKQILVDNVTCLFKFLDSGGSLDTLQGTPYDSYYRGSCVFVYAVNNRISFDRIAKYFFLILDLRGDESKPFLRTLVGNKTDLEQERQVTTAEGGELAEVLGASFLETSAKDRRSNILDIVENMARNERELDPNVIKKITKKCFLM